MGFECPRGFTRLRAPVLLYNRNLLAYRCLACAQVVFLMSPAEDSAELHRAMCRHVPAPPAEPRNAVDLPRSHVF